MVSTRQLKRVDSDRWVYRTERGDYGPTSTDGLLKAIEAKKVFFGTPVSVVGTNRWAPASDFPLFRDHFETCKQRWDREEAHKEAELIGRRFETKRKMAASAWMLISLGVIVGGTVAAWGIWRLSLAEPVGFEQIGKAWSVPVLPVAMTVPAPKDFLPAATERKVARLFEPESYDTAGVSIGTEEDGHVRQMHFSEDGEVAAISQADLSRVVAVAREGLHACAREAALKSAAFGGTEVAFTVAPGRITKIGVGAEARQNPAFQACIKSALSRVTVPAFAGSERRVTVPLKIQR